MSVLKKLSTLKRLKAIILKKTIVKINLLLNGGFMKIIFFFLER